MITTEMKTQFNTYIPFVAPLYNTSEPYVVKQPVYSSSLTPGTPTVLSASLDGGKCRIKLKFPLNVDAEDTYTDFVGCNLLFFIIRVQVYVKIL